MNPDGCKDDISCVYQVTLVRRRFFLAYDDSASNVS